MDWQQREYDRFGPWAIEVSDEDPPPPLFLPHLVRPDEPLLAIKVPRHIERRNAHPGMDLYDSLICLYEDDLTIMQRDGREVRTRSCRYRDVQHLRVSRSLLRGNIHLGLPGQAYEMPYNTVSDDLMLRIVDTVRERYEPRPVGPPSGAEPDVPDGLLSFYFDRLLAAQRDRGPDWRLLAAQGTVPVRSADMTAARRFLFHAAGKHLLEAMHFSDGQELMILDRGQPYAYRWETIYGLDTWYIPLSNIREVAWREDSRNRTMVLSIRTDGGPSAHVFARGHPSIEPYAAYLARLPEAQRD